MLNYLNQLEHQAKAHTHRLRREAEVERQLKRRRTFNWIVPVLNVVVSFGLRTQTKAGSYR